MMELVKLVGNLFLYFDVSFRGDPKVIPETNALFFSRLKDPVWVDVKQS